MTTTTEFPLSCRMIFQNWLEMCLHPCDVDWKSRCFQHAAQQRPQPCAECQLCHRQQRQGGVVVVSVYSYIFCASFISLLTLSSTFTSPNRIWEHNLIAYRRNSLQNSEGRSNGKKVICFSLKEHLPQLPVFIWSRAGAC